MRAGRLATFHGALSHCLQRAEWQVTMCRGLAYLMWEMGVLNVQRGKTQQYWA